jgi:hypothetical protein
MSLEEIPPAPVQNGVEGQRQSMPMPPQGKDDGQFVADEKEVTDPGNRNQRRACCGTRNPMRRVPFGRAREEASWTKDHSDAFMIGDP